MPRGKIKRLIVERGFGFIGREGEKDLFFHRTALQDVAYREHLDSLKEGQEVEFEIETDRNGHPQAINIKTIQPKSE